jgi:hypothetical protein
VPVDRQEVHDRRTQFIDSCEPSRSPLAGVARVPESQIA